MTPAFDAQGAMTPVVARGIEQRAPTNGMTYGCAWLSSGTARETAAEGDSTNGEICHRL